MGQHFGPETGKKGIEGEEALLLDFHRYLDAAGLRSAPAYIRDLDSFRDFCAEGGLKLLSVKTADLDSFRSQLLIRGMARATVNNATNHLKRFYRWAWKRRLLTFDPFSDFHGLSTGRSLPRTILSVAEMGTFLRRFALRNERDLMLKSMVELLYGSALRISEVESLHLADLEQEAGVILIHERKTGVSRMVPASGESLQAVERYLESARESCTTEADRAADFLYPQKGATSLRCLLNAKLARECRRLGLKRITTHSFRHAAATHLLQSGAGIRQVQAFLGHQNIGSTERYTHVVTEDLKAVIAGCHPRETSP